MKKPKHYLCVTDLTASETMKVIRLAKKIKSELKKTNRSKLFLKNKTMAMIFEKPSLRTDFLLKLA